MQPQARNRFLVCSTCRKEPLTFFKIYRAGSGPFISVVAMTNNFKLGFRYHTFRKFLCCVTRRKACFVGLSWIKQKCFQFHILSGLWTWLITDKRGFCYNLHKELQHLKFMDHGSLRFIFSGITIGCRVPPFVFCHVSKYFRRVFQNLAQFGAYLNLW